MTDLLNALAEKVISLENQVKATQTAMVKAEQLSEKFATLDQKVNSLEQHETQDTQDIEKQKATKKFGMF